MKIHEIEMDLNGTECDSRTRIQRPSDALSEVEIRPPRQFVDQQANPVGVRPARLIARSSDSLESARSTAKRFCAQHETVLHAIQPEPVYLPDFEVRPSGLVYVIVGPSGVGKTTLVNRITKEVRRIREIVSFTSRPPREGERDGEDYFFVDRPEAERMRDDGEFLECVEYHGNIYGIGRDFVEDLLEKGDAIVVMEREGLRQIRNQYPDRVRSILIVPPTIKELKQRLRADGRDEDEIVRRATSFEDEIEEGRDEFDAVVINDRLDETVRRMRYVIAGMRCKEAV